MPSRIVNRAVVAAARKPYCEYTGRAGWTEVHHIRPRGAGGGDVAENLVSLHPEVHRLVHDGKVNRYALVLVVARREKLNPEEVCARIGLPVPEAWPEWEPPDPPSLEEVLQAVVSLDQEADEAKWLQGEILASLLECGLTKGWLASQLNRSRAFIHKRVLTWRAFPEEGSREPALWWEHHWLAARTDDPKGWLARAAEEGWSTREMARAIRESLDPGAAKDEDERRMTAARRLYSEVEELVAGGGPAAEWLREKLLDLLEPPAAVRKGSAA